MFQAAEDISSYTLWQSRARTRGTVSTGGCERGLAETCRGTPQGPRGAWDSETTRTSTQHHHGSRETGNGTKEGEDRAGRTQRERGRSYCFTQLQPSSARDQRYDARQERKMRGHFPRQVVLLWRMTAGWYGKEGGFYKRKHLTQNGSGGRDR